MQWNNIDITTQVAITRFLKIKNNLPIKFISSNFAGSGEKLYYAYFEDTKLTAWYKSINSTREGIFRIIINEEFLNGQTQTIDLAAKIPSSFPEEKKVVLRIAYAILVAWQRCFIEAYKQVAPNKYDVTFANAKNWYDSLK